MITRHKMYIIPCLEKPSFQIKFKNTQHMIRVRVILARHYRSIKDPAFGPLEWCVMAQIENHS